MTQEQILEENAFLAMVNAIAEFKNIKRASEELTAIERYFISEKFKALSDEVKVSVQIKMNKIKEEMLEIELEIIAEELTRIEAVNHEDFSRIQIVDPENFPAMPEDLDEPIGRLEPRHFQRR